VTDIKKNYKYFIFYALLVIFISISTSQINKNSAGSHSYYIQNANAPLSVKSSPHAYRIILPLVVYILPVDAEEGFLLINYLIMLSFILLLHLLLCDIFNSSKTAFYLTFLTLLGYYSIRVFIYNVFLPDLSIYLLMLFCIRAFLNTKYFYFALGLLIGAFTKETILILVPAFMALTVRKHGFKDGAKKCLFYALPPVILYFTFRLFALKAYAGSDIIKSLSFYTTSRGAEGFFKIYTAGLIKTYGIIIGVILLEIKAVLKFISKNKWTLVLLIFSLILPFFDSDVELLLFHSFLSVTLYAGVSLERFFKRYKINKAFAITILFILQFAISCSDIFPGIVTLKFIEKTGTFTLLFLLPVLIFASLIHSSVIAIYEKHIKNPESN
jgi:hypothetical protein